MAAEAQQQIDDLVAARAREITSIYTKYFTQIKELAVSRGAKIRRIPNFWRTVLSQHYLFRQLTTEKDWTVLEALEDISVDEFAGRDGSKTTKLVLELGRNQILANATLWVTVTDTMPRAMTTSGLSFKPRYSLEWLSDPSQSKESLFRIFESEESLPPTLAETAFELVYSVKTDIWESPFKYYDLAADTEVAGRNSDY